MPEVCPDCHGSKVYRGLNHEEPCPTCCPGEESLGTMLRALAEREYGMEPGRLAAKIGHMRSAADKAFEREFFGEPGEPVAHEATCTCTVPAGQPHEPGCPHYHLKPAHLANTFTIEHANEIAAKAEAGLRKAFASEIEISHEWHDEPVSAAENIRAALEFAKTNPDNYGAGDPLGDKLHETIIRGGSRAGKSVPEPPPNDRDWTHPAVIEAKDEWPAGPLAATPEQISQLGEIIYAAHQGKALRPPADVIDENRRDVGAAYRKFLPGMVKSMERMLARDTGAAAEPGTPEAEVEQAFGLNRQPRANRGVPAERGESEGVADRVIDSVVYGRQKPSIGDPDKTRARLGLSFDPAFRPDRSVRAIVRIDPDGRMIVEEVLPDEQPIEGMTCEVKPVNGDAHYLARQALACLCLDSFYSNELPPQHGHCPIRHQILWSMCEQILGEDHLREYVDSLKEQRAHQARDDEEVERERLQRRRNIDGGDLQISRMSTWVKFPDKIISRPEVSTEAEWDKWRSCLVTFGIRYRDFIRQPERTRELFSRDTAEAMAAGFLQVLTENRPELHDAEIVAIGYVVEQDGVFAQVHHATLKHSRGKWETPPFEWISLKAKAALRERRLVEEYVRRTANRSAKTME